MCIYSIGYTGILHQYYIVVLNVNLARRYKFIHLGDVVAHLIIYYSTVDAIQKHEKANLKADDTKLR